MMRGGWPSFASTVALLASQAFASAPVPAALPAASSASVPDLPSPAKLVEALQAVRQKHAAAIWGPAPSDPAALRSALQDLDAGLVRLEEPQARTLADGSAPLASVQVNLVIDKIRTLYRLGDRDGALAAWRALQDLAWMDPALVAGGDDGLAGLLADARAEDTLPRSRFAVRWSRPFGDAHPGHALTRAERVAGLSAYWSAARREFVWFDHVPSLDWDAAYLAEIPRVEAARSDAAYWREMMRFAALLHDGHSNVYPPASLMPRLGARPGVRTGLVEGRVLVLEVLDRALAGRLQVGDELLRIDGRRVADHAAAEVTPYQSSSTPQDLDVRRYDYALLSGDAARPVRLTVRHADGKTVEVVAPRAGYETRPRTPPASFALRADGVAVLTASELETREAATVLEAHWDELRHARALVVDLRGDGGGSTENGQALLRHLTHAPLPTMRMQQRAQNPRLEHLPLVLWNSLPEDPPVVPAADVFDGPVALLVDARTFSSAEDTAALFRLMRRGPIVGMPTGGSTGNPAWIAMPGGGSARVCAKRDSFPDGSDLVGVGIVPDMAVPLTVAAVRAGRDDAMQAAVQRLMGSGS